MLETLPTTQDFSRSELVNLRWNFGIRNGRSLTNSFRFGNSGFIEDYHHENEVTWKLDEGRIKIFQRSGNLMWASESMFIDDAGRKHITLRTPVDQNAEFILSEFKAPLTTADFLFPKDLEVTTTKFQKVLLIGSCLTGLYHQQFTRCFPEVGFDFLAFNFAGALPEAPPSPVESYDFQYIQIPLRSILSDRIIWATRFNEDGFADSILDDGYNIIDVMLQSALRYNQKFGLLSFVSNFLVPQMSTAPSLNTRYKSVDLPYIVRKLNEYIAQCVSQYKNSYLVDINAIGDSFGKQYFLDDMIHFYAHGSIHFQEPYDFQQLSRIEAIPPLSEFYESKQDEFIQAVYDQMVATYRTVHQIDQVKAVVFDLDNTLWRGQLAEHYRPEQMPWPNPDGWPMGIWEAIHHLRSRGILVAVCSKNDQEMVEANWSNVVRPNFLSLGDFASVKINWLPKAENIRAICAEFNIKPKSVVFVDDNPVERAAVKAALPDIRVIGSNPYLTRRILLWAPETQIVTLTDESVRREDMIRSQIVREETRTTMTREQFLATLGCTMRFTDITSTDHPEFGRTLELVNKTNQFNTTGKRWSHTEIEQFLSQDGKILAFNVTDKFADYGLVGVLFIEGACIFQYVMSCRVLGMEVEKAAVAHVVSIMRQSGNELIKAPLLETPDNTPCRDVYSKSGFRESEAGDEGHLFLLNPGDIAVMPTHIVI